MRIIIEPSIADDSNAHHWLDRILHRVSDGWHIWDINGHVDFQPMKIQPGFGRGEPKV
ncbi:MAG: hypothetical protein OXF06_04515 [Bacteroidetes bacterium]|nr:hypothetical protein [Bacteroidota bacterium]MCY4224080.1 hypothetical protein [Bacteroidota bacterium]